MSRAQLAAVSYRARYSRRTHAPVLLPAQAVVPLLREHRAGPPVGIQRAHVEL
ncbi:MAG: hypothetical protein WCG47_23910 [Dermatophilaceae bacterium]